MELTGRIRSTDLSLFTHFHNSAASSDQSARSYLLLTYVMTQDITPSMLVLPTHTRPRRWKILWMDEGEEQPSGWVEKFFMNFVGAQKCWMCKKYTITCNPWKNADIFTTFSQFSFFKNVITRNLHLLWIHS